MFLPYREWRRLYRRAYRAQQRDHSEVCGVFATDHNGSVTLLFLKNQSDAPGRFELNMKEIIDARRGFRASGKHPVGIFHSHPISEAVPGKADVTNSRINAVHLIYDVCGITVRLWRVIRQGRRKVAVELPIEAQRSPR